MSGRGSVWIFATAALLLLASIFTVYSNFTMFDCSNDVISRAISGDGKMFANVVARDCGATTAIVKLVYLGRESLPGQNDGDLGDLIYAVEGDETVSVRWDGSKLIIAAPTSGQKVVLKKQNWNGVEIVYRYF